MMENKNDGSLADLRTRFKTKKYVEEDLSDAYKRVYVAPNDTLEVFLFYEHYVVETKTLDRQYMVKRLTALSLITMVIFLIFQIS